MLQVYCLVAMCGLIQIREEWTPINYDSGVKAMAVAVDSQLTREASYAQGSLLARITQEGVRKYDGEVRLVWSNDSLFAETTRYNYHSKASEDSQELTKHDSPPSFYIQNAKESWQYVPSLGYCKGLGLDKRGNGLARDLDVRPLMSWSTYSSAPDCRLSKIIKGFSRPAPPPKAQFHRNPDGVVRLKTQFAEFVMAPESNGDLLRYSTISPEYDDPEEAMQRTFLDMEWTWERDAHGIPHCKTWVMKEYKDAKRTEVAYVRTVEILDYNSQPAKAEMKFTLDKLNPAVGTRCLFLTAKGTKQWKYGIKNGSQDLASQADLDRLIEEAKQKGSSAPTPVKE